MSSVIADFNNQFKKMHPDVRVSTDVGLQTDYNLDKNNPYKRQITLNNLGKSAKNNYLISFILDTRAIYLLNDCSWTFADLRVYDTNEITELNFWVEAPNTPYTTIFVRVPTINPNVNKNIWIYYGNPSLTNKANLTATCGPVFASSDLKAWFKGNDVNRVLGGGVPNNQAINFWDNKANRQNNALQTNATNRPTFLVNRVNGSPAARFDGVVNSNLLVGTNGMMTQVQNSSHFVVFRPVSASSRGMLFQVGNTTTGVGLGIGNANADVNGNNFLGLFATIRWIAIANAIGTGYHVASMVISSGLPSFFFDSTNVGSIAGGNPANPTNNYILGAESASTRPYQGDIAEVLHFDITLTNAERDLVRDYLNTKYRVHSTADMPTITVGSQIASGSLGYNFLSYAPFSIFSTNSEPDNKFWGVASMTAKATIENVFNKVLASGSSFENWSLSTNDVTNKLTNQASRRLIAAVTILNVALRPTDSVSIQRLDGANNINDLGKFEYSNLLLPNTVYNSTNNDWIEFDFFCEISNDLDTNASIIRFQNANNTLSYEARLNQNINQLESNRLCIVKIIKSDFIKVGTGTWSDASVILNVRVSLRINPSVATQQVNYGNFQLKKNFQLDPNFNNKQPITLGNSVSSDQDVTYFNQKVTDGRIVGNIVSSYNINFSIHDYLEIIKKKTFGELASFPAGFACFLGDDSSFGTDYKRTFHSYFMRKILGFIFPKTYLDIDLDFLLWSDTTGLFGFGATNQRITNLNFFIILSTEKIEDVLDRLLNTTVGYLTYDQVLNKIVAKSGYYTWQNMFYFNGTLNVPTLQTPPYEVKENTIYSYKDESASDNILLNSLQIELFRDTQENGTIVGFGDGTYELQESGITVIFFEGNDLLVGVNVFPMTNFRVGGFNVSPAADSNVYNNTGIIIKSLGAIGKKVFLEIENTNISKRYLKSLNISGDYVTFRNHITPFTVAGDGVTPNVFQFDLEEAQSINTNGKNQYKLDKFYTYTGISLAGFCLLPLLYGRFISLFSKVSDLTSVDVQYQPELRYGKVVRVRNKEGRVIVGHVIKYETYSEGEEYTNTITVREIK